MTSFEIPRWQTKAPQVVSVKIDRSIVSRIDEAARTYGFTDRSKFIRFIVCSVLDELGYLQDPEERGLCFSGLEARRIRMEKDEPDHPLMLAVTDAVLKIKILEGQEPLLPPIQAYVSELVSALS